MTHPITNLINVDSLPFFSTTATPSENHRTVIQDINVRPYEGIYFHISLYSL